MKPNLPENLYFSPCRPNGQRSPATAHDCTSGRLVVQRVLGSTPGQ